MTSADDYDRACPPQFNSRRIENRTVAELIGISKALVADGVVSEPEAEFLAQWLKENRNRAQCWPYDVIDARVQRMLADGVIDEAERKELFELLRDVVGGKPVAKNIASFATTLPLTKPLPEIIIPDHSFCFTGKFAFGQRKDCAKAVEQAGGLVHDNITQRLDYLVIGMIGSADWAQSTFGRKIEKAVGYSLCIVGEDDWANTLCR